MKESVPPGELIVPSRSMFAPRKVSDPPTEVVRLRLAGRVILPSLLLIVRLPVRRRSPDPEKGRTSCFRSAPQRRKPDCRNYQVEKDQPEPDFRFQIRYRAELAKWTEKAARLDLVLEIPVIKNSTAADSFVGERRLELCPSECHRVPSKAR